MTHTPLSTLRMAIWGAVLVGFGVIFSGLLACAMPFAAFAAVAAFTLPRRAAFGVMAGVWAVNQAIGFGLQSYPLDMPTLAWSGVFAFTCAACVLTSQWVQAHVNMGAVAKIAFALCASFCVYEAVLYSASHVLGGVENFTLAVQGAIFVQHLLAGAGLLVLNAVGEITQLKPRVVVNIPNVSQTLEGAIANRKA